MARIRTIKPSIFTSRTVSAWPRDVRWTFAGLMCYADDAGRGLDEPRLIKAELYPLDDQMTPTRVERHVDTIVSGDGAPVCRYEIAGVRYLHFTRWGHQRINRPTPSRIPPCPLHEDGVPDSESFTEDSLSPHGGVTAGREEEEEGKRKRKGRDVRGSRRAASEPPPEDPSPTQTLVAEWLEHCTTRPPERVVGQVASEVHKLLDEGQPIEDVRRGLAAWHRKNLHPATIASVVHETRNAPHTTSTTNQRVSDVLALAADLRAKEDAQKAAEAVAQIGASA